MTTLNNSALNAINIVKLIAPFECALKKTRAGVFFLSLKHSQGQIPIY